jgi:RNA polymerase sigma-70 factor (ECF subfamily)
MHATADDATLLHAVAAGDRTALGALYDRYAPLMLGLAMRVLQSRRAAEDLVQDVFVEAWKRAGDFDARRGSGRTWLLLRLRSRAIDRKRSARLARAVPLEEQHREESAPPPDPAALEDRARVRRALAALPAEQQQVVDLAYFRGLSSSEIAVELEIPIGTVKSRVAAARRKLRVELQGPGKGGTE